MRVLISTRLGAGHIAPSSPWPHPLLRDSAEVIVTAPASGAAMIAAAGLDHHPNPDPREETAKLPPVETAPAILRALAG